MRRSWHTRVRLAFFDCHVARFLPSHSLASNGGQEKKGKRREQEESSIVW